MGLHYQTCDRLYLFLPTMPCYTVQLMLKTLTYYIMLNNMLENKSCTTILFIIYVANLHEKPLHIEDNF